MYIFRWSDFAVPHGVAVHELLCGVILVALTTSSVSKLASCLACLLNNRVGFQIKATSPWAVLMMVSLIYCTVLPTLEARP